MKVYFFTESLVICKDSHKYTISLIIQICCVADVVGSASDS